MNELKKEVAEIEYVEHRLSQDDTFKFDLLALANKQETSKKAWEIIKLADKICVNDDFVYQQLRDAVCMNTTMKNHESEFTIHSMFREKFSKENDMGFQIAEIKNDSRHIPDCWIAEENHALPVEIKLNKFDEKAREQLERYIEFYDAKGGIAVGDELTTFLPEYIVFIPIKDLKNKDVV